MFEGWVTGGEKCCRILCDNIVDAILDHGQKDMHGVLKDITYTRYFSEQEDANELWFDTLRDVAMSENLVLDKRNIPYKLSEILLLWIVKIFEKEKSNFFLS